MPAIIRKNILCPVSENIYNLRPGTYFHLQDGKFDDLNLKIGEVGKGSYFCFSDDSVHTLPEDHPTNGCALVVDPKNIQMTIDFLLPE